MSALSKRPNKLGTDDPGNAGFIGRRVPKVKMSWQLPDGWHEEDVADMVRFSHAKSVTVESDVVTMFFDRLVPASVIQRAKSFNWTELAP